MSATYVPLTPPPSLDGSPPSSTQGVWLVQGKKANKAFRSALSLHREEANLSEETVSENDPKVNTQCNVTQEEGHHDLADQRQHHDSSR